MQFRKAVACNVSVSGIRALKPRPNCRQRRIKLCLYERKERGLFARKTKRPGLGFESQDVC
jgi:hypothetical protein